MIPYARNSVPPRGALCRLVVTLILLICAVPAVRAQSPGDLDETFAGFDDGIVDNGFAVRDMAIQPDGKIVVAGSAGSGVEVRRFLENGEADDTFGTDGKTVLSYPGGVHVYMFSVAVGPSGHIYVGGGIDAHPASFAVGSLDRHGNINTLWNSDGWIVTDFDFGNDYVHEIIVQPDGKVVAAGWSVIGGDQDFSVARYQSWGDLDNSFDGDGKRTVGFGDTEEVATGVAIQPDGRIVVSGGDYDSDDGLIMRLMPNGSLDDTFGGDGKISENNNSCESVAVQANGKIVLAGYRVSSDGDWKVAFHRRNADGSIDLTLAGGGVVYVDLGTATDRCWDVAVGLDGRIIGNCEGNNTGQLVRIWPDGSFDTGGKQTVGLPDNFTESGVNLVNATSVAMAVQTDGRIILAGEVANPEITEMDFAVTRLNVDGTLDKQFGVNGRAQLGFFQYDVARAVAIQPDGRIVVAGHMVNAGVVNFMVARFNTTGTEDGSFGFGGVNVMDFLGGDDVGSAMALAPDGKIVMAGYVHNGTNFVFGVARFNTNGTPDNTFDGDGKRTFEFVPGVLHEALAVVVQPDLKIIVGGSVNNDFALVRFNENGSVDASFGTAGTLVADMGGNDRLYGLAQANDNWIYAVGSRILSGNRDFAMAQISPDGILCTGARCGRWGKVFKDFGGTDIAYAVDVRNDGKVVMAGGGGDQFAWAQYHTAAAIDTTPVVGLADFHGTGESARAVQFAGPDWILTGGRQTFDGEENFAVARFITSPMAIGAQSGVGDGDPIDGGHTIRLLGAYPNPLVGRSVIAFDASGDKVVQLRLYDVTGRLVRTLAEERFAAGRQEIAWDGTDDRGRFVAAGMYYIRLEADGVMERRSVVVVR